MVVLAALLACAPAPDPEAPDCSDVGEYRSVGQPFLRTYCTACHSRALGEGMRHGAPVGVELDRLEDAVTWGDRILARVDEGSMPPNTIVRADELERLRGWLGCGAPGTEPEGYSAAAGSWSGTAISVQAWPRYVDGDADEIEISRNLDNLDTMVSVERYRRAGSEVWLLSHVAYDPTGAWLQAVGFPEGLPLGASNEVELEVAREGAAGDSVGLETWTVSRGEGAPLDPHEISSSITEVVARSESGESLGWHFTPDRTIDAAWVDVGAAEWELLQSGSDFNFPCDDAFPVEDGHAWVEWGIRR